MFKISSSLNLQLDLFWFQCSSDRGGTSYEICRWVWCNTCPLWTSQHCIGRPCLCGCCSHHTRCCRASQIWKIILLLICWWISCVLSTEWRGCPYAACVHVHAMDAGQCSQQDSGAWSDQNPEGNTCWFLSSLPESEKKNSHEWNAIYYGVRTRKTSQSA